MLRGVPKSVFSWRFGVYGDEGLIADIDMALLFHVAGACELHVVIEDKALCGDVPVFLWYLLER